jgi:thiaminase
VGSWGVRAHDSDDGLDLLIVAVERYLRGVKFKTFHVKHISQLLRSHIINEFAKESYGWEAQYIDFFYDCTFPCRYAHSVMLVAECFAEYRQKGKYLIRDYKTDRNRRITDFIFTKGDLESLGAELQSILDPAHSLYDSWKDSAAFNEWQSHIQMLRDILTQAITEGGDGCA